MSNPIDIQNAIALLHGEGYSIKEPPPPPKKVKIEITPLRERDLRNSYYEYTFGVNTQISKDNILLLEKIIENSLNEDTVVEYGKIKELESLVEYYQAEFNANQDKVYTKVEVDAMMEDSFNAARVKDKRENQLSFPNKYKSFSDYKATLPVQQVPIPSKSMEQATEWFVTENPNREAKDKPFVWTDELVEQFYQEIYCTPSINPKKDIQDFKKSKQSPTNLQESKAPEEKESSMEEFLSVGKERMKKYDQEPQSPTVKPEYEIVSFESIHGEVLELDEQKWKYRSATSSISDINFLIKHYSIKSVRRLSDGEVFSIGDKIGWGEVGNYETELLSFRIKKDRLEIEYPIPRLGSQWVDFIEAVRLHKKPLPTPNTDTISSDNSDVACLSLNDLSKWYEAWYSHNPMKDAFLNGLKQLVNQKLKQ